MPTKQEAAARKFRSALSELFEGEYISQETHDYFMQEIEFIEKPGYTDSAKMTNLHDAVHSLADSCRGTTIPIHHLPELIDRVASAQSE